MTMRARGYIPPPIGPVDDVRDALPMETVTHSLGDLRAAAARLSEAAAIADPIEPRQVIAELELVLRGLSVTCYTLGTSLTDERGRASGQRADQLSREDRRNMLAALHTIGAAVGSAARVCRTERRALDEGRAETVRRQIARGDEPVPLVLR
jgi:hypothetical protein